MAVEPPGTTDQTSVPSGRSANSGCYDEMVKVLAGVWSQEAASIAQEIKRLP